MSFGPPPPAYPPQQPPPPQGPEFLATDKGRAVVVDAVGVCFENFGQTAEFGWHEVGNVHFTGQGTCLRVGVTHASGAFVECMVDAKRPEQLQQWFAELAPVLGFYLNGRSQ
ncbi:hypothetical protein RCO28_08065 [Streptomyces sp. LHD-70]|uniref:hypothetical protein n=1 Tax=Streptomyces sp. LHD-70 TaxID=3072140 RepID=UPI00280F2F90|nr:hypothetical protein [Streptomyces sp. LHD-70]MDQ8702450.1 hypothetical protein [Streptomyces sp. LHD-70]